VSFDPICADFVQQIRTQQEQHRKFKQTILDAENAMEATRRAQENQLRDDIQVIRADVREIRDLLERLLSNLPSR